MWWFVQLPALALDERCLELCPDAVGHFQVVETRPDAPAPHADALVPETVTDCSRESEFASIPLAELGFGVMDIVTARSGEREVHIEISGDRARVFGEGPA